MKIIRKYPYYNPTDYDLKLKNFEEYIIFTVNNVLVKLNLCIDTLYLNYYQNQEYCYGGQDDAGSFIELLLFEFYKLDEVSLYDFKEIYDDDSIYKKPRQDIYEHIIVHEIAHSQIPEDGHGEKWNNLFKSLKNKLYRPI